MQAEARRHGLVAGRRSQQDLLLLHMPRTGIMLLSQVPSQVLPSVLSSMAGALSLLHRALPKCLGEADKIGWGREKAPVVRAAAQAPVYAVTSLVLLALRLLLLLFLLDLPQCRAACATLR